MSRKIEEIYGDIRKNEQAILLANMEFVNQDVSQSSRTYKNFVQVETDDPTEVISRISRNPGGNFLLKLPTEVLSLLVPTARFFLLKNFGSPDVPRVRAVEITFDDRITPESIENIISSSATNTGGIGMKSFSWDFIGTDYSQQKNNIKAELSIFMQSIHEFDKTRVATIIDEDNQIKRVEWQHSDLVTHSVKADIEDPFTNRYNRIYAIVGYALPPATTNEFLRESVERAGLDYTVFSVDAIRDAIANSVVGMDLFLTNHDISYEQDGTVNINLKYHAAIEGILTDPKCDIFMIDKENATNIIRSENFYKQQLAKFSQKIKKLKCDDTISETARVRKQKIVEKDQERLEDAHSRIINERRSKLHSSIVQKMLQEGMIKFIKIKRSTEFDESLKDTQKSEREEIALEQLQSLGINEAYQYIGIGGNEELLNQTVKRFEGATSDSIKSLGETNESIKQTLGSKSLLGEDLEKNEFEFPFVYFGDILNVAYSVLYDKDLKITNGHQFRALLGPMIYYRKTKSREVRRKSINIADIPISFHLFTVYLIDNIVRKDRVKFPLIQFVSSLIESLLQPVLSSTYATGLDFVSNVRVRSTVIPGRISDRDIVTGQVVPTNTWGTSYGGKRVSASDIGLNNFINPIRGLLRSEIPYSYFYIYATSGEYEYLVRDTENGEYHDDKRGIYTLRMGIDRGLVKKIKFRKTDLKYLTEARIQRAFDNDNEFPDIFSYFTEKYDADVDLLGAPFFMPGHHVFIDPITLGTVPREQVRNTAKKLGLGGYYLINNVRGNITANGNFDTDLKCIWVSSGDDERQANIHMVSNRKICK